MHEMPRQQLPSDGDLPNLMAAVQTGGTVSHQVKRQVRASVTGSGAGVINVVRACEGSGGLRALGQPDEPEPEMHALSVNNHGTCALRWQVRATTSCMACKAVLARVEKVLTRQRARARARAMRTPYKS